MFKRQESGSVKIKNIILLFIGSFSLTQIRIIGSIGISELVVFVWAPILFLQNYSKLRTDGFMPGISLALLALLGCFISSLWNGIAVDFMLRGVASTYSIFAFIVCFHHLLRGNFSGIKWLLLGLGLTGIISTFVFQRSVESMLYAQGETGIEAAAGIMSSPIYWIQRINPFVALPYKAWYLSTPTVYSVFAPLGMALFSVLSSTSGRSAALGMIGASFMMLLARKSAKRMNWLSKHFFMLLILALVGIFIANLAYRWAATSGVMGEKAREKYEAQSQGSSSVLRLLMSGRLPFFVGLYAACQQPIFGYGPWAVDKYGYTQYFLSKYGTDDDYDAFLNSAAYKYNKIMYVPAHSHIIGSWIANGIFGLIFWIYVLCKIFEFVKRNLSVVPQWYGLLAAGAPSMLWDMFFSPYSARVYFPLYFTMLLFANAIAKGKMMLPQNMIMEIIKNERK